MNQTLPSAKSEETHWSDDLITQFRTLYSEGVPNIIIGLILGRSQSSVQTRASRLGLPERLIPEYATRNRLRWTEEDFSSLEELHRDTGGVFDYQDIKSLSNELQRSVDTIIGKIKDKYGLVTLEKVVDDYKVGQFDKIEQRKGPPGAPPNTNRRCCVSHCRKWFWAKDRTRDYKCNQCREAQKGMSDTDLDFWSDY